MSNQASGDQPTTGFVYPGLINQSEIPNPRESMLTASEAVKVGDFSRAEGALLQSLSDLRKLEVAVRKEARR